jgi:acyl carrier protein
MEDISLQVRKMLMPVFGIDTVEEINSDQSLVQDLGAESLDFVEIVFLIENEFGIKLETKELLAGGISEENIFAEGKLTEDGVRIVRERLPDKPERFKTNMTKMEIFMSITVGDLIRIISQRKGATC